MRRRVPELTTDEQAEAFLDQDLSDLDFAQFEPVDLVPTGRAAQLTMRMPRALFDAAKVRAAALGLSYSRYIRELIERDIGRG